jgi:hypothetical protein
MERINVTPFILYKQADSPRNCGKHNPPVVRSERESCNPRLVFCQLIVSIYSNAKAAIKIFPMLQIAYRTIVDG